MTKKILRGDLLSYDKQRDDTIVMFVSPDCVCYLVNVDKGEVHWQYEDKKKKIYEASRNEEVDDYLDVDVDKHGRMHIYRYNPPSDPERVSCDLITPFVQDTYGEDVTFTTSIENLDVHYQSGTSRKHDHSQQHFHIKRADYKFSMHSSEPPYVRWHLECSSYKAYFEDSGVECHVYHALNQDAFIDICRKLKIARLPDGQTLKDVTLIHETKERIKISHPEHILYVNRSNNTRVMKGTFEGLDVAVKIIEKKNGFSTICDNVWSSNINNNVVRLMKVEIKDSHCYLAFELCKSTFYQHVKGMMFGTSFGYVNNAWLSLFRGIILGVRELHKQRRCHGNLNSHNILVSTKHLTKLSGLTNSTSLTEESKANDLYALGKVLLLWFSQFQFDDMTTNDPLTCLSWIHDLAREGHDIIRKLLQPDPLLRPTLENVFIHPWLWSVDLRLDFLRDVSDHLQHPNYAFLRAPIESIQSEVFPAATLVAKGGPCWGVCFRYQLINEMVANRKNIPYRQDKVQDLLRFLRNIMNHHVTISVTERGHLGQTRNELEYTFRKKFPALLINVYTTVERALQQNPGSIPRLEYYYDEHN